MFREILVASGNRLTLELPDDLVGREIEVLAFALPPAAPAVGEAISEAEMARRTAAISAIFDGHRVDLSNFKFDRDEANNYDE